jgi:bleomycin hydrolase
MKRTIIYPIFIYVLTFLNFSAFSQKTPEGFTIKYKIPTSSVKNQNRTGTCWSFTTVSYLETEAMRNGKPEYDLSEMFIVYKAYKIKADLYVRLHGNANFSEGGQAHDVLNMMREFGVVPEEIFKGNNYGTVHNHENLVAAMEKFVKKAAKEEIVSFDWETPLDSVLNYYLGKTPATFKYKNIEYTPQSFVKDALALNPDDYIEFTSYTHHPFYTKFDLEVPDNWAHGFYYNLPVDDLIQIMDSAIIKGYSIAWDGDVSGSGFDTQTSFALLTENDKMSLKTMSMQDYRQKTFDNFTTTDDHLMHIVGIVYDKDGKKYYLTKNSWGIYNNYDGYLFMSEDYVKVNTIAFMVNKNAVPKSYKEKICKK